MSIAIIATPRRHVAVYVRVSTKQQDQRSQLAELKRWAETHDDQPIKWYEDAASGKTMERPGWQKLQTAITRGEVCAVVCWRIDRLGRTAAGLTKLFEELAAKKINLVSLKDGLDLSTPAGRMMANMLASVAQFETELRGERVRAGIAAAMAKGKKWGGSEPGVRKTIKPDVVNGILDLKAAGRSICAIAKLLNVSRSTVYSVLRAGK